MGIELSGFQIVDRWIRSILLAALVSAGLALAAGSAFAHASLLRAEPADGAMLARAPEALVLTFSEPVSPLVLRLVAPDGSFVTLAPAAAEAAILRAPVPAGLGTGSHVLTWRVISQDGHPVAGSVLFSIGEPTPGVTPAAVDLIDWPVRGAIWSARLLLYAGLFMGVGGAVFAGWIGGGTRRADGISAGLMMLALAALAPSVGFQGLDALGAGLGSLNVPLVWRTGFDTSYGTTVLVAAGALALGLASLMLRGAARRVLSLAALVAAGYALTASGHASTAEPRWLTRPAVFAHAIGIAFWSGALVPLSLALRARTPEAAVCLRRFSHAAPFAVLPLLAAGLVLAAIQLGRLDALRDTAYGAVLIVKLALLFALLALALANRWWLTAPAERLEPVAVARLRRSISAELGLILAIFAVAALWRFTPPPRALAEAAAEPATVHMHTQAAMVDLSIVPGRVGVSSASMGILTGNFEPLDARAVTLVLSNPVAGVGPQSYSASKPGDGTWRVEGLRLSRAGRWVVRIDILEPEAQPRTLEGVVEIRP